MGIIDKYASHNFFDNKWWQFERQLEEGRIPVGGIPAGMLIRTSCMDCNEDCLAIRYRGRRILIHGGAKVFVLHQCPQPSAHFPDQDEPQRDGDGNLV